MKVSDAVVEVAANQMAQMGCEGSPGYLMRVARAALEAALPLVLGEAVAWIYEERYGVNDDAWIERINRGPLPPWEHRKARPLYAPKEQQP